MSKEMLNTNKAVIVNFPAYINAAQLTNTASANIYIPFPVKQIYVKGIDLDFDADARTLYFTSNLVDNGPLGSGYAGILCDNSTTTKNVSYIFPTPRDINGTYNFTYNVLDSAAIYFPNGFVPVTGPNSTLNVGESPGMPTGRVLFILAFFGYM